MFYKGDFVLFCNNFLAGVLAARDPAGRQSALYLCVPMMLSFARGTSCYSVTCAWRMAPLPGAGVRPWSAKKHPLAKRMF